MNETDVRIVIISGVTKHRTGTKYRSFPLINRGKTYIWVRCRWCCRCVVSWHQIISLCTTVSARIDGKFIKLSYNQSLILNHKIVLLHSLTTHK